MGRSTLPQLLMEQFDTLPIQCRHSEHMHEGVIIFVCTDSTEIFFSRGGGGGGGSDLKSIAYCFFSFMLKRRGRPDYCQFKSIHMTLAVGGTLNIDKENNMIID